jgi:hydrogenase maturation protein HypF
METVYVPKTHSPDQPVRAHILVRGAVQGVGFRPFIYRLASELGVTGTVNNSSQGVVIEAEGAPDTLEAFVLRIQRDKPPRAIIHSLEYAYLMPLGYTAFEIQHSDASGAKTALILPDIATCPDCLREMFDPANRRYLYPFTNCTNCGPRFSIIQALPYDRPNTTMQRFAMCEECCAEYENPLDRRFHAQPNACPVCGPQLALWDQAGNVLAVRHDALLHAAEAIRRGEIVAVKGLGGFHLMVDARNEDAIQRLRQRKHREEKPFAVMCPTLESVRALCEVSELEAELLCSPEAPIVLVRRRFTSPPAPLQLERGEMAAVARPLCEAERGLGGEVNVASAVAPGNPNLGVMLPYTPLHHLLMRELGFPVVATSGNLSDEPICTDEDEALTRLGGIANLFLVHDRPIARHADDSVVRIVAGREQIVRRARGYAPLPIHLKTLLPSIMAVGAHLKNTVAASVGTEVFVSQHIGDLDTVQTLDAFKRTLADFQRLYNLQPEAIACDLHPDYLSTQYARRLAEEAQLPLIQVQHHYAHVLACMADNDLDGPVLGVSWDGTGYGLDGTVWGGEFLRVDDVTFSRAAHLRTFRLPGGDKAIREPRRTALGLLYELFGDDLFNSPELAELAPVRAFMAAELASLRTMLTRGLNAPFTSSAGRLFDAVAAIARLRQRTHFEGQAAMELEFGLDGVRTDACYEFDLIPGPSPTGEGRISGNAAPSGSPSLSAERGAGGEVPLVIDWGPLVRGVLTDVANKTPRGEMAARFHNTLAEIVVAVAQRVGEARVVLTGGCFQNKYLAERTIDRLRQAGLEPYWHRQIPANDGGIALGQIMAVARVLN